MVGFESTSEMADASFLLVPLYLHEHHVSDLDLARFGRRAMRVSSMNPFRYFFAVTPINLPRIHPKPISHIL